MALAVKDLALSLLWLGFRPWPGNFCMLLAQPKMLKNKTKWEGEEMAKDEKKKKEKKIVPGAKGTSV